MYCPFRWYGWGNIFETRLVCAGVEGGLQASGVLFGININVGGSDLRGAADFELTHEFGCWATQFALGRVLLETGTRIGNIQVAHRQLTNAIVWSEGGVFNAFHREFFWCVGQVRSGRVQDRVIIAATQAQGNFTGDGRTYP